MKDGSICPKCGSENTYQIQDWLGREDRGCDNKGCECIYRVEYKTITKSITIKQ